MNTTHEQKTENTLWRDMPFKTVCELAAEELSESIEIICDHDWFEMTANDKTFVARKTDGRFPGETYAFQYSFGTSGSPAEGFTKRLVADELPATIAYFAKEIVK